MKVSYSWLVPAGRVWLLLDGVVVADRRLREKLDGVLFNEIILNQGNERDKVYVVAQ
jgi:hypothetical protein